MINWFLSGFSSGRLRTRLPLEQLPEALRQSRLHLVEVRQANGEAQELLEEGEGQPQV